MKLLATAAAGLGIYIGLTALLVLSIRSARARLENHSLIESFAAPLHLLSFAIAFRLSLEVVEVVEAREFHVEAVLAANTVLIVALFWTALKVFTWLLFEFYFRRVRGLILPDILQVALSASLCFIAFIGVMHVRYDYDVSDLIVTSAIVALVFGIAFQSSLAGLLTGMSVTLDNSLAVGDFVDIGGREGWIEAKGLRTMTLRGLSGERVLLPNRQLVAVPVVNYRGGAGVVARVEILAARELPPNPVKDSICDCALQIDAVLPSPPPRVSLTFSDDAHHSMTAEVAIADPALRPAVEDALRSLTWYRLRRDLEHLRSPGVTDAMRRRIAAVLAGVPVFSVLEEEDLQQLADLARRDLYGKGERLFRQGDPGDSLYVVEDGRVQVTVNRRTSGDDDRIDVLAVVGKGGFLGERSLLTGEPRFGTATLLEDSLLVVIDKTSMGELVLSRQEIVQRFAEVLAQQDLDREELGAVHAPQGKPASLVATLTAVRAFFGL